MSSRERGREKNWLNVEEQSTPTRPIPWAGAFGREEGLGLERAFRPGADSKRIGGSREPAVVLNEPSARTSEALGITFCP